MAAIFPPLAQGGVPPGPNTECAFTPTNPVIGEGPLYASSDCTTLLTSCQLNSLTSEILAAVDELGFAFNTNSVTNLGDALAARIAELQDLHDGVSKSGDTMTGPLNLVCPPTANDNAACKLYVDETARDAADACCAHMQQQLDDAQAGIQVQLDRKVNRDGDQMTGPLILSGDPTVPDGAATKAYVDAIVGGILVAPEPPTGIANNRLWWNSEIGALFIRFDDQWVQIAPGESIGGGGGGDGGVLPGGNFLALTGGWLSGPLMLHEDPTLNLQAATKHYVDQAVANVTGAFIDAPADGFMYARQDEEWERITGLADDAPEDGEIYGRQDGQWVVVSAGMGDVDGGTW